MHRWQELKLKNFTGPLDLLLNMIKEKKINIFEVDLLELCNQYLSYIDSFVTLDIEIASEYLIMTTYLIELKSKHLIPKLEIDIDQNSEESQRDELLAKLLEYHKIKEVTQFFKDQQNEGLQIYSKPKSLINIIKIDDDKLPLAPLHIDIEKFGKIFLRAIERNKANQIQTNTLIYEELSPDEIAIDIQSFLQKNQIKSIKLENLIESNRFSLQMLVATFLAVLTLASKNLITIEQNQEDVIIFNLNEGE